MGDCIIVILDILAKKPCYIFSSFFVLQSRLTFLLKVKYLRQFFFLASFAITTKQIILIV